MQHERKGSFRRLYFSYEFDDVLMKDVDVLVLVVVGGDVPLDVFVGESEIFWVLAERINIEFFYFLYGLFVNDLLEVNDCFLLVLFHLKL